MSFVALAVWMTVLGLLVGGLARFALPGRTRLSLWWTAALGVAATVFSAYIGTALFGTPGVPLLPVLVAMVILGAFRWIQRHRAGQELESK